VFAPLGPDLVEQVVPSGNTINDNHYFPGAKQLGVKVELGLSLLQDLP